MAHADIDAFVNRAEGIYAERLKFILEPQHLDEFVAIEPDTGDFFLGRTLNEAARAARARYPDRQTHVMKIGHRTALHFGMNVR